MGDVQQVLGQGPRVAVEHLGVGGETGRALDVAVLGHHALEHHQRGRAELEAVAAEQGGDDHVATGLVGAGAAQHHLVPDPVDAERLMHLGHADLGRAAGVLEAGHRRGPGAAGVAGHVDHVGAGLGHPDRDGADAFGGDQLDDHPDAGGLAVVDQLGEVLDRVGVVVRRRRDELDPGCAAPGGGDVDRHLRRGQLAALAGLGALTDLDLQLLQHRVGQVAGPDAEPSGGELLDPGAADRPGPGVVLAALAAVGHRADHVGAVGDGLVGGGDQGAVAHRPGGERGGDLVGRLHLVQRHAGRGVLQQGEEAVRRAPDADHQPVRTELEHVTSSP